MSDEQTVADLRHIAEFVRNEGWRRWGADSDSVSYFLDRLADEWEQRQTAVQLLQDLADRRVREHGVIDAAVARRQAQLAIKPTIPMPASVWRKINADLDAAVDALTTPGTEGEP